MAIAFMLFFILLCIVFLYLIYAVGMGYFIHAILTTLLLVLGIIFAKKYILKTILEIITNREIFFMHLYQSVKTGRKYIEFNHKADNKACIQSLGRSIKILHESVGLPGFSFSFGSENTQKEIKKLQGILTNLKSTEKLLKADIDKQTFTETLDRLEQLNMNIYNQKILEAFLNSQKLMNLSQRILGDRLKPLHIRIIDRIIPNLKRYPQITIFIVIMAIILILFLFTLQVAPSLYEALMLLFGILGAAGFLKFVWGYVKGLLMKE